MSPIRICSPDICKQVLALVLFSALLVANAVFALRDGTGEQTAAKDLPKHFEVFKSEKGDGLDDEQGNIILKNKTFEFTVDSDSNTSAYYEGHEFSGQVKKDWSRDGLIYYYVVSDNYLEEESEQKYYMRIVLPRDFRAGIPKEIAYAFHNIVTGAVQSHWFILNQDGAAIVGASDSDYEELVRSNSKSSFETGGTWKLEDDSQLKRIRVETDKEVYTIQYTD